MAIFQGRYRIDSARLEGWDYSGPGWYFVTTCLRPRMGAVLCDIRGGRVRLSPIGRIVEEEWQRTQVIRTSVRLDAHVIMPDHLHGIICITHRLASDRPHSIRGQPGPSVLQAGSLGAIIGQFKSKCTKRIRAAGYPAFAWQPRFHDRVIRDSEGLVRIRRYIANNPRRWSDPG